MGFGEGCQEPCAATIVATQRSEGSGLLLLADLLDRHRQDLVRADLEEDPIAGAKCAATRSLEQPRPAYVRGPVPGAQRGGLEQIARGARVDRLPRRPSRYPVAIPRHTSL